MSRQMKLATLAAMTGNGIFGFSFMFSSIALRTAHPFVMLMYRFWLAAIVLSGVALWSAGSGKFENTASGGVHWLRFNLKSRRIMPLMIMGVIQPVAYFLCESYGISLTNATLSGVIIALEPIAALAGGFFLLGETPRRSQVLFSLISIAGVVMMTLQQNTGGNIHVAGVVLLIGAVLSGMAFHIVSRKLSGGYSALERTFVMMLVGAVVFTGLAVATCRNQPAKLFAPLGDPAFLMAVVYLGVVSSVIAFLCLNFANDHLPVAKTTAFCNLTTVISLFAGVVFLRDPFNWVSLAASGLIILGIWGVQKAQ